jgi:MscS family membrane protein
VETPGINYGTWKLSPSSVAALHRSYIRVGEIMEKAGSGFAFPSTTAYITRDGGIDMERGAEAEKKVALWRQENRYPFPETPPQRKRDLQESLEYPPKG